MTRPDPPMFSVVLPTRDRPEFVGWCLEAIASQRFQDFEVVVSDNGTTRSCRAEFERFADTRFRYVVPDEPLSMADNWELAHSKATGRYLITLTDKTTLFPSALQRAAAALAQADEPDIATWWSDGYDLGEDAAGAGSYRPYFEACSPQAYDPRAVLRERIAFAQRRGSEGVRYYWGKSSFGAYRHTLVERIRAAAGRVFRPIAPDYTSMTAALLCARSAIDVGEPLQLMVNSAMSNGQRQATDPRHALRFLEESDPTGQTIDSLPVPGVYTSVHNLVAYDYESTIRLLGATDLGVDPANLAERVAEDLARVAWTDPELRREHYRLLDDWCAARGLASPSRAYRHRLSGASLRERVTRSPRLKAVASRVLGHRTVPAIACRTVIEATQRADDWYASSQRAGQRTTPYSG